MFYVATALLFNRNGKLLIYLRDDNPAISFPNYWDLFGGIVQEGETPEQALVREVKEELDIELEQYTFYREYDSQIVESEPNKKFVFYAKIDLPYKELHLQVGQRMTGIDLDERSNYKFANILGQIIDDFAEAGIIP